MEDLLVAMAVGLLVVLGVVCIHADYRRRKGGLK